ncbi:MAG: bifunctional phosphoribosylaminoimidazolecarboxamide formyltransferase/IMP cyclohydrolase [Stygiobacter sp. RIFOXYC12_FULL_38_8]|nr:MAG: bifunctional phosphoribosylaminoimidazolecarboxamide formyltransferase/IMP cyclohydrolase [Stygiobacter sp. RIFOXYA12_FULL_38_9]OGV12122.1 MAG: bifunctional phosphoribosylaminoimidazolecarboxamide formyltransferase/IMP cyclohydrolase [Stygiobacter sp. RIFOXYC2_FULL_38_25]OGV26501.1 MAG: bifunctional phosphoribosylaminoimidazolecarboxamide formyltransferase/IMP cyclohydrolase [Stygiobacter sp. RIFOXYC12_FULL_38_8]OGV81248.1 MAG: bifunctional phosphoribosylaminoimidazolecarboxamide formylt
MSKYALISVSDKSNVVEFARELTLLNYQIIATGNTYKLLMDNAVSCIEIKDFTKFPEIFSGRVKTLHPKIFGGILMRRNHLTDHSEAEQNEIEPIDIICVNLYPFPKVVDREDISLEEKIENIDIGGPSLIRASAKNYKYVSVLTDSSQYKSFLEEIKSGGVSLETKKKLAYEAFAYTSYYDTLIANYLEKEFEQPKLDFRLNLQANFHLRYGENPHQKAFLFGNFQKYFEILHGKELSYNNIVDLVAAVELVNDLEPNACAIIKHTNPCGVAIGANTLDSYVQALSCDNVSAFGGIVSFNGEVDEATAEKLNEIFLEIVVAPSYTKKALEILGTKKNRRIVKQKAQLLETDFQIKSVPGGVLVQEKDNSKVSELELKVVTTKQVEQSQLEDLKIAWTVCKHTKSNAIVFVKDKKAIGVGAGQMSRVDSARLASEKAKQFGHNLNGAVAASDAYFPFADGLIQIAEQGITAVIQPGGSVRDEEVINAANEKNIAMVFTGIRNFKH